MIHFGTSGWRGIVGQDFTFRNVRRVLDATIAVLDRRAVDGEVLVSYDTRLLSEKLAREAVAVVTHHGRRAVLSDRDLPSPCLAYAVRERSAALGVMFTASHNPPEYNGVKLYQSGGVLAAREFTDAVEAETGIRTGGFEDFWVPERTLASTASLSGGYLDSLDREIDWDAVRRSGIQLAVDPLFGTAREFLDRVLLAHEVPTHVLHATKDPYFGGFAPECTPPNLARLREQVRRSRAALGLATDGDADRFGVVSNTCRVVSPNLAIALLVSYLITRRGVSGAIGRTHATTRLVDRVAGAAGLDVVETPVGFHHFGPMLLDGRVAIATEESAGLGVASHLPERDGIFAALLVAEMIAVEGATLADLARRLYARHGTLMSRRVQLPLRDRTRVALTRLGAATFKEFAGVEVTRFDRRDGLLLELADQSWVLIRAAGTEPKLRIYAEGNTSRQLRALVQEARRLIREAEEGVSHVRD
jgi:phosphoglucomutase